MLQRLRLWLRAPWADLTDRERVLLRRFAKIATIVTIAVVVVPFSIALLMIDREAGARISGERRATIERAEDACVETNDRHEKTDAVLRTKIYHVDRHGKAPKGTPEAQAKRAEEGYRIITTVIDALVPYRVCDDLIKERFNLK